MTAIKQEDYQKRLDSLTEIFTGMIIHADATSKKRCPYKNRFDECTAKFACHFQRSPAEPESLLVCSANDGIDYCSAWEKEPAETDEPEHV